MMKNNKTSPKFSTFSDGNETLDVTYIETQTVKDGVECDIYKYTLDESRDLAVVRVSRGFKTPLQEVVSGTTTIESYLEGAGTLTIRSKNGKTEDYTFGSTNANNPVSVEIGQVMQWSAAHDSDLVFAEICTPPYHDGRFKDLLEKPLE